MKRVKVMLATIALVAIAGSTVAFKASKFGSIRIYQKPSPAAACTLLPNRYIAGGTLVFTNATTTVHSATLPATTTAACASTFTFAQE